MSQDVEIEISKLLHSSFSGGTAVSMRDLSRMWSLEMQWFSQTLPYPLQVAFTSPVGWSAIMIRSSHAPRYKITFLRWVGAPSCQGSNLCPTHRIRLWKMKPPILWKILPRRMRTKNDIASKIHWQEWPPSFRRCPVSRGPRF